MKIREATLEDAKRLDELLTLLIEDEYLNYDDALTPFVVKDFYKNVIVRENTKIFLCEENEKIVGYVYGYLTEEKKIIIDALFVMEEYRKKGIATQLLECIKSWAKEIDISIIEISVLLKNEKARSLYQKMGFMPFKETLRFYESNHD